MSTDSLEQFLSSTRDAVNRRLEQWGERAAELLPGPVGEAIAYSLGSHGKRLRPALLLATYRELGGAGDASELAASVEIVHTYSLVHDDLPCMDDDDLRRGRATTHIRFGVDTATEAGFRMVPLSARVMASGANTLGLSVERVGRIAQELYGAAGAAGMIRGQVLDLEAEGRDIDLEELVTLHRTKTGALIAASVVIGALAAGADEGQVEAMRKYGGEIGLAFQIVDDILDATGTSDELGKTAGKDARQQKANFVSKLGVEGATEAARRHTGQAVDCLQSVGHGCTLLVEIARYVVERKA